MGTRGHIPHTRHSWRVAKADVSLDQSALRVSFDRPTPERLKAFQPHWQALTAKVDACAPAPQ